MRKFPAFLIAMFISLLALAQEKRDYAAELAQLEAELDSLSIFSLLDSVISSSISIPSELSIRAGFSSNTVNAGRNYGVDQYGYNTGASFYHRKGLYLDLSSYWNSDYRPQYTVSMASFGYLGAFRNKLSYSINYERWMYNPNLSELSDGLKNSIGGFGSYDIRGFFVGLDYAYLFNSARQVNRIIGTLGGTLQLKNKWIFDRISILPNLNMVYGNDEITIYYNGSLIDAFRNEKTLFNELGRGKLEIFLTDADRNRITQINRNDELNRQEKKQRITLLLLSNPDIQEYIYTKLDQTTDQYGIMNYSLSFPVTFQINKWRWMIAYSYSIPISLPGENFELDPLSYFTSSLSYQFQISSGSR